MIEVKVSRCESEERCTDGGVLQDLSNVLIWLKDGHLVVDVSDVHRHSGGACSEQQHAVPSVIHPSDT